MNQKMRQNKGGQITIFIIIAIVIIALLVVVFYKNILEVVNPKTPVQLIPNDCIKDAVKEALNYTMMRGGSINPELYYVYNNYTVEYLCYTSEWYKTCGMQKPLLKQSIEKEVKTYSSEKIKQCLSYMESEIKRKGYNVKVSGSKDIIVDINPNGVKINLDYDYTLEKEGVTETIESSQFETNLKSGADSLIVIASSIQNYEARYGDSEITSYMAFYPNIKVEKYKKSDGTKIYIISDRDTGEKLQFATRSLAWPPGYATVV